MNEKYLIPLSIIFSSIIIITGFFIINKTNNNQNEITKQENIKKNKYSIKKVDPKKDHIQGSKNADIYIIEYADMECAGCKAFQKIKKELVKKYKNNNRVGFVFRHFPLYKTLSGGKPIHPTSGIEARAMECAAKLGGENKFFEMKDKIFATTKSDGLYPIENLTILAESIGIKEDDFTKCISSDDIIKKIEKSWSDAYNAGVKSTPSIFVQIRSSDKIFKALPGKKVIENAIDSFLENN